VSICFNWYTVQKILCGIAQLDVGDVTKIVVGMPPTWHLLASMLCP
jgi:hypothetical protein